MTVSLIKSYKFPIVNLDKLVKRMGNIAILCAKRTSILICQCHIGSVNRKCKIGLMIPSINHIFIHGTTGSHIQIVSIHCHSRGSILKRMHCIDSFCVAGKTAISLYFPVFGVFGHTVNFSAFVLIVIVLPCQNIIVAATFVKCTKQRKRKWNSNCSLNVIGVIVILYQNLVTDRSCLNAHQATIRTGCQIRADTMTIHIVILCFHTVSSVHVTSGFYIRVCLDICFHCRIFHSGFQRSIHRACHYFLFYFRNFLFCGKFLYFVFIRIRKCFFSGAKCIFFTFFCAVLICKSF